MQYNKGDKVLYKGKLATVYSHFGGFVEITIDETGEEVECFARDLQPVKEPS